ncbi:MAG: S1/P1 nuclease, partial [Flavisolibacter sp.]
MRCVRLPLILLFSILLLSWGQLGHRTIGVIAEKHLTAKARQGIQELLGNASLSDVANWADEVRRSPEYRTTGPWHYINLPLGLSRSEFDNMVTGMQDPNVYQAVRQMEQQLRDPARSQEERIDALKFLVHFVGDLHQPMHVSRAEDQGGNKIQVNFLGKGTNLHSLWDTGLPEQEGLNEEQLAARVDKATPAQIMVWQNEPLLQWLWESYQLSSSFYQEVDALSNRAITVDYYNRHQSILEERMEKAGIRLAGLLNA